MPGSSIKPFEVPFAGGYQQKKAEPWVDASAQTDDVNVIWIKSPAPEKRPGYLGLTRSVVIPGIVNGGNWFQNTVSTVAGFFADESGVCVTDGTNLYTYSTANTWQWADFVSPFVCTRKTVTSSETSVFNPDVAEYPAGDVRVFVWEDGTGSPTVNTQIRYAMKSISTGAVIATGIVDKNTTGIHPRVFVLGSDAYVLWGEFVHGSAGHVYYSSAPLTTANGPFGNGLTWQSATALVSNRVDFGTTQGGAWDVAVADDGSGAVLVYENTSHQIVVQKYKSPIQNTLVVDGSSAVVANETGTLFRCLGVRWAVASDTIWIGIGWSSDNRAQAVNFKASTLVQQIGSPVAIQLAGYQAACTSIAIEDIGGVGWYVWSHGGGTVHEPNFVRSASVTSPGGAIVQGPVSLNVQLCSRPSSAGLAGARRDRHQRRRGAVAARRCRRATAREHPKRHRLGARRRRPVERHRRRQSGADRAIVRGGHQPIVPVARRRRILPAPRRRGRRRAPRPLHVGAPRGSGLHGRRAPEHLRRLDALRVRNRVGPLPGSHRHRWRRRWRAR
jgi:hypothetical protein